MIRARLLWSVSWRGLLARRSRSVLTALSVAVAVAGLTVFLSLGAGLRLAVEAQVSSIRPQVQVSRGGPLQALAPPPTLSETVLRQVEAQTRALNLKAVTPVVLSAQTRAGTHLTLYGIPAAVGHRQVYPHARVGRGRSLNVADEGQGVVILGHLAARRLGVDLGDRMHLAGNTYVRVIGVLAPTTTVTDAFVITPLRTLQRALNVPGRISLVAVEVRDPARARVVAESLAQRVDAEVQTQDGFRDVLAALLRSSDALQRGLAGAALLVGFLTVLTTLSMSGHERRAELGLLRALGLRPGEAAALILLDGLLLSLGGGMLGLLAGWGGSQAVSAVTVEALGVPAALTTPGVLTAVLGVSALMGAVAALPVAWVVGRSAIHGALRSG